MKVKFVWVIMPPEAPRGICSLLCLSGLATALKSQSWCCDITLPIIDGTSYLLLVLFQKGIVPVCIDITPLTEDPWSAWLCARLLFADSSPRLHWSLPKLALCFIGRKVLSCWVKAALTSQGYKKSVNPRWVIWEGNVTTSASQSLDKIIRKSDKLPHNLECLAASPNPLNAVSIAISESVKSLSVYPKGNLFGKFCISKCQLSTFMA